MKKILRTCTNLISVGHLRKAIFSTNPRKFILYFIVLVLFTVEILTYYVATFSWHSIDCDWKSECTRILIVADPQLIGIHDEKIHYLTPISVWDSDRYLSKTFTYAFQFAQPDVVIFLGDLFDEGSTATDQEFKAYIKRFHNIFVNSRFGAVRQIWLPGDNDIGGELHDRITPRKLKRFEHAFKQPDVINVKDVKFCKINRLMGTVPKIVESESFSNLATTVVGLSHLPLLLSPAAFIDKVLDSLHPTVLFTAHAHTSMIVSTHENFLRDRLVTPVGPDNTRVFDFFLDTNQIYEILVPTCSYRMGTDKIGYGFAVIESNTMRYTVLWTPSRFPQLIIYGIAIFLSLIYLVYCHYSRCGKRDNTELYSRLGHIA